MRIYKSNQNDDGYEFIYFENLTTDCCINFEECKFVLLDEDLKEDRLTFINSNSNDQNTDSEFICYELKKKSIVFKNP